jgi:hypothetical protein
MEPRTAALVVRLANATLADRNLTRHWLADKSAIARPTLYRKLATGGADLKMSEAERIGLALGWPALSDFIRDAEQAAA